VTRTGTEATGLVRVSVVGGDRRADLAVPGTIAVADLLPELASAVGVLDPYTVHGGFRLVRPDGRSLEPGAGLTIQGVEDGAVLALEPGWDATVPAVYDDVIEAVAHTFEAQSRPWGPASGRRTALAAAALLLGVAAAALALMRSTGAPVAAIGTVLAALLVCSAAVLARAQREPEAAAATALLAVPYAAAAGLAAAPAAPVMRLPLALAGAGVVVAAAVAMLALIEYRALLLPPITLGAAAAVTGAVLAVTELQVGVPIAVILVLAVLAGPAIPALAMALIRINVFTPRSEAEIRANPGRIDPDAIAADVRVAHELFLSLVATVGLVVVLAVPFVVQLGVVGAALAGCACAALILRARQYRASHEVAAGLGAGVAGFVVLGVSGAVAHPGWRPALSLLLILSGVLLLAAAVRPGRPSLQLGRAGDVAEGVSLVALLPLLVLAAGALGAIRS